MPFCENCGAQLPEGTKFCGGCGQQTGSAQQQESQSTAQKQAEAGFESLRQIATNTKDHTSSFDSADIEKNKTMGGLAYILFFLPLLACPESKYARFHANQGLIFLLLSIVGRIINSILYSLILAISWRLFFITTVVSIVIWLAVGAVGVIGLINGFTGKAKELPIIGGITIIK